MAPTDGPRVFGWARRLREDALRPPSASVCPCFSLPVSLVCPAPRLPCSSYPAAVEMRRRGEKFTAGSLKPPRVVFTTLTALRTKGNPAAPPRAITAWDITDMGTGMFEMWACSRRYGLAI